MAFRNPAVNYYVDDVEACVKFYVENFGFVESFRTPPLGQPDHVEIRLDGFILGLASRVAAARMHDLMVGPAGNPRSEVVLWTDDVDTEYKTLVDKGVSGLSAPHTFLGKIRSAWVSDPEGNPIQIVMKVPAN